MKEKKKNGILKIDNNTSRRISTYGRWLKGTEAVILGTFDFVGIA